MKKRVLKFMGYVLLATICGLSCKKIDTPLPDETGKEERPTAIYVSGYSNETTTMGEVIWKDGLPLQVYNPNMLTAGYVRYGGEVYDLDIVNDDVYAVWRMSHKALSAYYSTANVYLWKNDINTAIAENNVNIHPKAVDVHGQDVYFAGYYIDQYQYPSVWKNGKREQLPGGIGSVNDLLVNNTAVLAVGHVRSGQSNVAAFWKNGELTKLGEGNEYSAHGMAQLDNDIYVAGEGKIGGVNAPRTALLWKNGTQQILENPTGQIGASANAVAFADGKVYVAGYAYQSNNETMRATVWANGSPTILSQSESRAFSVATKGSTVYVCGFEKPADKYIAVLWKIKDGTVETVKLSKGTEDAQAYCIKVQ